MWMFSSAHLILLSRYIREIGYAELKVDYVELKVGYAELTQHASTGLFNFLKCFTLCVGRKNR